MSVKLLALMVVVGLCLTGAASQSRRGQKKKKFCPLERDGDRCASSRNQFKCAVFYHDLPGQSDLTWIGGLPHVLNNKKVQKSAEIRKTFGDMKPRDFVLQAGKCTSSLGNSRCYAAMLETTSIKLDTCNRNILNKGGEQTLGDYLCERLDTKRLVSRRREELLNVKIGYSYSACGSDWKEIASGGKALTTSERLCCRREASREGQRGKFRFFRCDGSAFRQRCGRDS